MKKKLLILLKSIDGGTGTYLDGMLKIKKLYKHDELEIKILVVDYPKYRQVSDSEYIFFNKLKNVNYSTLSFKGIVNLFGHISWFRKNTLDYQPNIVIASNVYSIFLSEVTRYIYGFKYKTVSLLQNNLLQVIDYKVPFLLRKYIKNIFVYIFRRSDSVVTVSNNLSKHIYNLFKLRDIPATIEALSTDKIVKRVKKDGTSNRIITVARLDGQKDYETLLKAFKIVKGKLPNAELFIVGDGPLRKKIEDLSKRLKLDDNVIFFGWDQDPYKLMDKSDLFVLCSKFEGFPLVLLEAMGRGLPVISSNCKYGPYEIILNNKYGMLFEVGDVNKLAYQIIDMLENKSLLNHYSKMSMERVRMFNQDNMLLKFKKTIDNLSS